MNENIDFELIHSEGEEKLSERVGVLLFHGLTGSPFEMKKYGKVLFEQGYDVYCYSFPGHGNRLNEIQSVTWKDWCNFAQEKYNELRKGYEKFFVSGLCLGATVALYLAEHNEDITGIVVLSTTLFLDGFSIPKIKIFLPIALNTIVRYYYTFPEDESLGIKNTTTRKSLAKIMSRTTVGMDNYPLSCVYELLKLSKEVRKHLKKVTAPILIMHSRYDNLSSIRSARVVIENICSQEKRYIELQDSYHMVLYDNEKEYVMKRVKEFLEEIVTQDKEEDKREEAIFA